jgi:hypothetical protein
VLLVLVGVVVTAGAEPRRTCLRCIENSLAIHRCMFFVRNAVTQHIGLRNRIEAMAGQAGEDKRKESETSGADTVQKVLVKAKKLISNLL